MQDPRKIDGRDTDTRDVSQDQDVEDEDEDDEDKFRQVRAGDALAPELALQFAIAQRSCRSVDDGVSSSKQSLLVFTFSRRWDVRPPRRLSGPVKMAFRDT